MKKDQEVQALQDPEFTKFFAEQQAKLEGESKFKLEEMDKHIAYSEKIALRDLKTQAFRMAIQIRPTSSFDQQIGVTREVKFTAEDLIISANKIYNELIK